MNLVPWVRRIIGGRGFCSFQPLFINDIPSTGASSGSGRIDVVIPEDISIGEACAGVRFSAALSIVDRRKAVSCRNDFHYFCQAIQGAITFQTADNLGVMISMTSSDVDRADFLFMLHLENAERFDIYFEKELAEIKKEEQSTTVLTLSDLVNDDVLAFADMERELIDAFPEEEPETANNKRSDN